MKLERNMWISNWEIFMCIFRETVQYTINLFSISIQKFIVSNLHTSEGALAGGVGVHNTPEFWEGVFYTPEILQGYKHCLNNAPP